MPYTSLTRLGVPHIQAKAASDEIIAHATHFKRHCESQLLSRWQNLARMPCAHNDATPLEEILEDAYQLQKREYLVALTNWIWDTLVDKYGFEALRGMKPAMRVASGSVKTSENEGVRSLRSYQNYRQLQRKVGGRRTTTTLGWRRREANLEKWKGYRGTIPILVEA